MARGDENKTVGKNSLSPLEAAPPFCPAVLNTDQQATLSKKRLAKIDRRVAEKEEEFNNIRKNQQRAMGSLGVSL